MASSKKEHLCDKMWVSLYLIQSLVTKLQAQNPSVLIDGLDGYDRDGIYLF